MRISDVAKKTGVSASALRFYERQGLLPAARRVARRRIYDSHLIGRVRIVQLARRCGFSVRETKIFVNGLGESASPSSRWKAMADRKVEELDAVIQRAAEMKNLLLSSFRCNCSSLVQCADLMSANRKGKASRQG